MIRDKNTLDQLIDMIRKFVDEVLIPNENIVAETDNIPKEIIQQMKDLGLFGLTIPQEYGGLGLTMEEEVYVTLELGRASPAFRSLIGTNNGIGAFGLITDGTEDQKSFYLPKMATGEIIGSFCLTEPDVGSDASSIKTTAIKDGDFYILNGTKRFITNGPIANVFTVMARTNPDIKGSGGISAFIVDANTPGITRGKRDKKMGQKGALTCDIIFENCKIPSNAIIGNIEGVGFKTAMKVLDKGRIHIAALSTGAATRILEESVKYAIERTQFGQPIANFQLIQAMLADSKAEIFAARSMTLEAARGRDEGKNVITESSCSKMFATEMCGRVADRGVQIHGGSGYISEYCIERFYRDVRLFRLYEGTTQIQQIIIARNLIKEVA
jgi:acyl-CoA dehydrogenase